MKSCRKCEARLREFSSTVKQAEGVVCIECPVAKENGTHFLSLSCVVCCIIVGHL